MNFKKFTKTAKIMGAIAIAANLAGCGQVINEGNFGIEKYWGGEYNMEPVGVGLKMNLFDKIYEVYGREFALNVENAIPKDKNSVMLRDLDITVIIKIQKEKAIPFLLKTGDISIDADSKAYVLGKSFLRKDAQSAIGETIRKFSSEEILDQKSIVERGFTKDFQAELDRLYGAGTFEVGETKFTNVLVAQSVEEKIQSIAMVNAEREKNKAVNLVLESRLETLGKEASTLKKAADAGGISVDQLLNYEMIKAIREGSGQNIQVTTPAKPKP